MTAPVRSAAAFMPMTDLRLALSVSGLVDWILQQSELARFLVYGLLIAAIFRRDGCGNHVVRLPPPGPTDPTRESLAPLASSSPRLRGGQLVDVSQIDLS